jgi:predicted amidohydrolase
MFHSLKDYCINYNSGMTILSVSVAQIHIALGDVQANLHKTTQIVEEASLSGAELIVFPELWLHGYDLNNVTRLAQQTQEITTKLTDLASQSRIWIFGSILRMKRTGVFNTLIAVSPDGVLHYIYDKIHLFKMMHEDQYFTPGQEIKTKTFPWGVTAFSICYDLRFPEMHRKFLLSDAQLCITPAEWPIRRVTHWSALLQARAIENQMFYIGSNCVGETGNVTLGGASAIISPWGEILAQGSSNSEQLLTVKIDVGEVKRVRDAMPIRADRRPDIYSS